MDKLIFDTSAILNFGKRGQLDGLLERLAESHLLLTTSKVIGELSDPESVRFYPAFFERWFKIQEAKEVVIELGAMRQLATVLGSGELSVIFLAKELNAIAVLDDKAARRAAKDCGINVTGTLALLADSIKSQWHKDEQCIEITRRLYNNGFRIRQPRPNETFHEYYQNLEG